VLTHMSTSMLNGLADAVINVIGPLLAGARRI
jgi:hypothetical protein